MAKDAGKKEDYARSMMESYVREWKIFIDTCSLLATASDKFWMNMIPLLRQYEARIIIPLRCVEELEKHAANVGKAELAQKSKDTLKILQQMVKADFVEIRGEETDNFADNVFQVVFTKFRMTHKLLLITQDNNLAKDILALNGNKSVKANPVHVKSVNQYGFLSDFFWKENGGKPADERNSRKPGEAFRICKSVTSVADTLMEVSHVPQEQETVYTPYESIRLIKEVAAGGEGIIYTTDTPYVAKIYKRENNTKRKYEKIKLMLTKHIDCEGICSPTAALYNVNKEFVGYLMPKANGKELQKSIFIKPLFIKNFPDWKKRDTVELCITILEKIKYLHDRNVIMGDINPANILVVSPKEVYFVDTDSYQVEEFPCPVGTNNYTAPEIQRKHFAGFLRTIGNENFAVATLLFMIMLPGKPPYSQQGGEDPIANIIKMDFSYPFGENSNRKTPDGPWRYIWSHLTYDLKKAFYNTFKKGGDYAAESTRLSVEEWLSIFRYYLELLDSGKFGKQDKMSEELFPARYKRNPKVVYATCKLCGSEVAENQCQNGMCRECLNKGELYKCEKCGKEILFTNYQKYIKNMKKHDICPECFAYGNEIRMTLNCVDCGRKFELTNNQYDYFTGRGLDIPKRCPSCREAKKNRSYSSAHSNPYSLFHSSEDSRPSQGSDSSCFITTAVCGCYGKADDCQELTILRDYRDTWLRNQPGGEALIVEYYKKAPRLAAQLKASEHYEMYCEKLWTEYIRPCLDMIEKGIFEECRQKYCDMVRFLESILCEEE